MLVLQESEKYELMKRFPNLELSYENILHRKVVADLYFIIPKGIKTILWFTYFKKNNICFILELNRYDKITKITPTTLSFDSKLSYNTILYGTLFKYNDISCFTCENIHYYKGKKVEFLNISKKLDIMKDLFMNNLNQNIYNKKMILIGLPIMSNSSKKIQQILESDTIPYNLSSIQCYKLYKSCPIGNIIQTKYFSSPKSYEAVFQVQSTLIDDIYNLFYQDKDDTSYHNIAMIPDYKTSIFMNKIFRNIKENDNLDLLEESDDEEEFENISKDKFVNLEKCVNIKCIFNKHFKKWQPIQISPPEIPLTSKREILLWEKNNI